MKNLDYYKGRDPIMGHSAMFSKGVRFGNTREEEVPVHFVRMGGISESHVDEGDAEPEIDCVLCMATAARKRQCGGEHQARSR